MKRILARVVAWLVGDVLRIRRQHVEDAMAHAGDPDPAGTARAMYRTLAEHLIEVLTLLWSARPVKRVAVPHGALVALGDRGRGAIVATAHTGNWDLTACAVAQRVPLSVVTKHLSFGPIDVLWQHLRRRFGVHLVSEGAVLVHTRRALREGRVVAMMIDQVPMRDRSVTWGPFLNRTAPIDLAPALLAMRAGVPLVVAFGYRDADGQHRIVIKGTLLPPRMGSRRWAEAAMQTATTWLDEFVRAHPEQWLWMHRRWTGFAERVSSKDPRARGLPAV
jgi:KDO2-lipid IV(A) lauroyltransferase